MDSSNETRDDVLHVPNLFDYFCSKTAEDTVSRGDIGVEGQATSFAGIIITILASFAFWVFGLPGLAKASFVLFAVLMLWTVWGAIIRSSEKVSQKADNIRAGVFPPNAAPYVLARLKWWNHLIVPQRWGRHSRLFDRRSKLERKVDELEKEMTEALSWAGSSTQYRPPTDEEIAALAEGIQTFSNRKEYEAAMESLPDKVAKVRASLVLHKALLYKLNEMSDKLDRIEKLTMVFHNVSPEDLSQVVAEAIQLLEERRILVLNVDQIDPDDFVDLVTVRTA